MPSEIFDISFNSSEIFDHFWFHYAVVSPCFTVLFQFILDTFLEDKNTYCISSLCNLLLLTLMYFYCLSFKSTICTFYIFYVHIEGQTILQIVWPPYKWIIFTLQMYNNWLVYVSFFWMFIQIYSFFID